MSKSILKNSSKIGGLSLISRLIAFMREFLLIRFLSIGEQSDLFFAAFRVPNTMRKIFAEGLLSSILIPAIVSADHKGGKSRANKLTTLAFLQIESLIALFCLLIYWKSEFVISLIVPGFGEEKIIAAGHLLKILISFILFISSGAIFAAALQAHKKFFIPALAPAILNVLYVITLAICLFNKCSIALFSFGMLLTSVGYFILHIAAYLYLQFKFAKPTAETWGDFKIAVFQFIPCFISSGILEINHFVNTMFASYLQTGSLTLIRTAYQFVNIPVGIIAASLSTVLLPHFSKLHLEKSDDIGRHVLEAVKFTIWSILPVCFLLYFFSKEIFETLFMCNAEAMNKIPIAQSIFSAYLVGLFAFALNKIFLSIFYAMRLSFVPMLATLISILVNYSLSRMLMVTYKAAGIAFAASASSISQTIFFLIFIYGYLNLTVHWEKYLDFFIKYLVQLSMFCSTFLGIFYGLKTVIASLSFECHFTVLGFNITTITEQFFLHGIGIWFWAGPLSLLLLFTIYRTRKSFGIDLAYFDKE